MDTLTNQPSGSSEFGFDRGRFDNGNGPGPDGKFCSSCGRIIKKNAEICPFCGVRVMAPPFLGRNKLLQHYLLFCWTFIPKYCVIY